MLRLLACCLIGFATMIFGVFGDVARQATSVPTRTPTPTPMRSLFEADTCAPPCWFGLIPGQSTSKDIVGMVQAHSDIFVREEEFATGTFYPHTEHLIDGYYSFYLRHGNPRNVFVIREGVLSWMRVALNKGISLHRVLEAFGQPDDVYTTVGLSVVSLESVGRIMVQNRGGKQMDQFVSVGDICPNRDCPT